MSVLGYLAKSKWGLGPTFGAPFLHDLSIKMFGINTLSNDKVSMLHGKMDGKMEMQKFEYLENKKSFLDKIKTIFHSSRRVIIW